MKDRKAKAEIQMLSITVVTVKKPKRKDARNIERYYNKDSNCE